MIARLWRGWTASGADADAYAAYLRDDFLPSALALPGFLSAEILRREDGEETAFMTITRFESVDAIKAFAGADYEQARIAPRAREWLTRWDERSEHYEVAATLAG